MGLLFVEMSGVFWFLTILKLDGANINVWVVQRL